MSALAIRSLPRRYGHARELDRRRRRECDRHAVQLRDVLRVAVRSNALRTTEQDSPSFEFPYAASESAQLYRHQPSQHMEERTLENIASRSPARFRVARA